MEIPFTQTSLSYGELLFLHVFFIEISLIQRSLDMDVPSHRSMSHSDSFHLGIYTKIPIAFTQRTLLHRHPFDAETFFQTEISFTQRSFSMRDLFHTDTIYLGNPVHSEIPFTQRFLSHRDPLLCARRWSSSSRTPPPPSVCTPCSTCIRATRSTPMTNTITCRLVLFWSLKASPLRKATVKFLTWKKKTVC